MLHYWYTQRAIGLLCMPIGIYNSPLAYCVCQLAYTTARWTIVYANWHKQQPIGLIVVYANWHIQQANGWDVLYANWHTQQPIGIHKMPIGIHCIPISIHNWPMGGMLCMPMDNSICHLAYTTSHPLACCVFQLGYTTTHLHGCCLCQLGYRVCQLAYTGDKTNGHTQQPIVTWTTSHCSIHNNQANGLLCMPIGIHINPIGIHNRPGQWAVVCANSHTQ